MRRYWIMVASMLGISLALFFLVEALGVPLLTDPSPWLDRGGAVALCVGVGLLIVDVALPVPASLVMIAHGALFGVVGGAVLSLVGSTGAALAGFAIGRRGGPLLARLVPADERARADRLLARWGMVAVVVTRPVPILAETTAVMAGASTMGWAHVAIAAVAGSLPAAVLYALTGALAASFEHGVLVFGLVLMIAGGVWLGMRWVDRSRIDRVGEARHASAE